MIVIKLGGSVITDKDVEKTLRPDVLRGLARSIASIDEPVAIVHGAGSYGHKVAKATGVGSGPHVPERNGAVARISADVRELNLHVINALAAAGLKPVSIPPSSVCVASDGEILSFAGDAAERWSERGLTPVTFGDVVADERMGVSIVSGDQLMMVFGTSLSARLAVFAADVDGVFDRPPAEEGAVLLTEVTPDTEVSFGEVEADVTGALKGKTEWMFRMADAGIETWVVNGRVPERLPELISTGSTVGTRIVAGGAGR